MRLARLTIVYSSPVEGVQDLYILLPGLASTADSPSFIDDLWTTDAPPPLIVRGTRPVDRLPRAYDLRMLVPSVLRMGSAPPLCCFPLLQQPACPVANSLRVIFPTILASSHRRAV